MPGSPSLPPFQQEVVDLQSLYGRVRSLENPSSFIIPALNNDSAATQGTNAWVLTDGRLHIRTPNGTVHEYAPTSGSGTSTNPFTVPTVNVTSTSDFYPAWIGNYKKAGASLRSVPNDQALDIGKYPDNNYNGVCYGILQFPTMHSTLFGNVINWAYLHGKTFDSASPGGTDVKLGAGFYAGASPPSSYSSSAEGINTGHVPPPYILKTKKTVKDKYNNKTYTTSYSTKEEGQFKIALSSHFRTQLESNTWNGITILPRDVNSDSYVALDRSSIFLRVNYTS